MITSNKIIFLLEKYLTSKRMSGDRELIIYENPDTNELHDLIMLAKKSQKGGSGPYLRFIADTKNKKVYVWDSYEAEHTIGRSTIGLPSIDPIKTPWLLYGLCEPYSGYKLKLIEWPSKPPYSDTKFYTGLFNGDWNWLNRYIDTKEYFEYITKRIEVYKKIKESGHNI